MNEHFYNQISRSSAHRKCRDDLKNLVFVNNTLLLDLVTIAFNTNEVNHVKACWILELICEENLKLFEPFKHDFCENLKFYRSSSAIRSISKICLFFSLNKNIKLTSKEENLIIEACLDWLITTDKAANAAYTMRTLYQLGKKHPWVHDELKALLQRDCSFQTPGYKSAVKDILNKLISSK